MVDFGSDISTFPDLDETFSPISGRKVVAEAVARWLSTPRGSMPFYPTRGIDLRQWLNARMTDSAAFALTSNVEAECEADERVLRATATVAFEPATTSMRISIDLELADGPFKLVLWVSQADLQILTAG
jgi:phage baseplate assembly protein W